jgi:hypothetical protein
MGQALVEAALLLPLLIMLLLLGIDLGRAFFTSIDLRNAAHEATMLGGTEPESVCQDADATTVDIKTVIDRQMGRSGLADDAICGPLGVPVGRVFVTQVTCESCSPWDQPYPPESDLRFMVRLEYKFQPLMPLVGLLTGNGVGGSVPMSVENRNPVLVGYEGT